MFIGFAMHQKICYVYMHGKLHDVRKLKTIYNMGLREYNIKTTEAVFRMKE